MTNPTIPEISVEVDIPLPTHGLWLESVHLFDDRSAWTIRAALAAQRPLQVRGEPGAGKSQLARAAAETLGCLFVSEVVHTRSESQDLQWRYDAVARLGDAQALGATRQTPEEVCAQLHHRKYLSPGVLWWVLDWESAQEQYRLGGSQMSRPLQPEGWRPACGSVLTRHAVNTCSATRSCFACRAWAHPPW